MPRNQPKISAPETMIQVEMSEKNLRSVTNRSRSLLLPFGGSITPASNRFLPAILRLVGMGHAEMRVRLSVPVSAVVGLWDVVGSGLPAERVCVAFRTHDVLAGRFVAHLAILSLQEQHRLRLHEASPRSAFPRALPNAPPPCSDGARSRPPGAIPSRVSRSGPAAVAVELLRRVGQEIRICA